MQRSAEGGKGAVHYGTLAITMTINIWKQLLSRAWVVGQEVREQGAVAPGNSVPDQIEKRRAWYSQREKIGTSYGDYQLKQPLKYSQHIESLDAFKQTFQ